MLISGTVARSIVTALEEARRGSPVVAVVGPRQSGKTTLVRHHFAHHPYANLEDLQTRAFATDDPRGFLAQFPDGAVLDEVQRTPSLLSQLQVVVDEAPTPGRFILTGSAQLDFQAGISQTLAGRVAFLRLFPFAHAELPADVAATRLEDALFRGAYPPVYAREVNPRAWYADYITSYVERDVRQLLNVQNLAAFQRFLALCAGNVGQLLNLSRLAGDTGITVGTVRAWLGLLEATFVAYTLRPHHRNFRKRVVKTPKLYFYDTGVVSSLLGIEHADQLRTHPLRGALFENWVIAELLKGRFNRGRTANLFFWRDHVGQEVDVLVDHGTTLLPIEIKSGATIASDWVDPVERFASLAGADAEPGVVVHGGDATQTRGAVRLVPWSAVDDIAASI